MQIINAQGCEPEPEVAGAERASVTGIPQASGQGAGRGRQSARITCPDGMGIDVGQDVEGQGGGGVSP